MRITPISGKCSIVLVGKFNPAIIQPWWLVQKQLVDSQAAENAQVSIINPDLTLIKLDHFALTVQQNQFTVESERSPFVILADFVCRLFGDILGETPIKAFGINRTIVFGVGSQDVRDKIGRKLAPWEPWGELGSGNRR